MKQICLLSLYSFSATGGIEQVSRMLAFTLSNIAKKEQLPFVLIALHDNKDERRDARYISEKDTYVPCGGNLPKFFLQINKQIKDGALVVMTHVNLLPAGWFAKRIRLHTKLVQLVHGIEVWQKPTGLKKIFVHTVQQWVSVSRYTKLQLHQFYHLPLQSIEVINNCLDVHLPPAAGKEAGVQIRQQLNIPEDAVVLFALTRLAQTERPKGYTDVIEAMGKLKTHAQTPVHYILAGKCTQTEETFIKEQTVVHGVQNQLHLPGYIAAADLPKWYAAADAYVLPSKKEGFGLSFIEALHYNLPVIAGNADGSADALVNGALGILVTPGDITEIATAIQQIVNKSGKNCRDKSLLIEKFGAVAYRHQWEKIIQKF